MVLGIIVVAFRITIKEEKMWSSCMAPQGHNCPSSLLSRSQNGAYKQQNREFGLFVNSIPLSSAKSFKNPNFLNDFKNHCHIIDKIREKCPEVIPKFEQVHQQQPTFTSSLSSMCVDSDNNMISKKQRKREHHKGKKHMHAGKKSKQLSQKKEIKELMQIDSSQDVANFSMSMDISFSQNPQEEPHNFILADFIAQKPLKAHPPLRKTDPIHIPISKGAEMFVMISPSPSSKNFTQFSLTDSEDSFIVFEKSDDDDDDNEEEPEEQSLINIKKVQRQKYPSVCESEDSFIVFDGGDEETDDDTSFLSSSEEESSSEDEEASKFDEVDCSAAHTSYSQTDRTRDKKKVRFVSDEKLCEVHSMIKWSFAYQSARKGPWEMYARDRCRFKDRILRVEWDIKNIFNRKHRERIYKERFENFK
ncbi:unnamed protein product [Ceutorhynchus assimilis]|uniref:Protein phosphatase 1 regulatory subunit 15A/B C-terminal domain-containing protein n=1 Tax=Ceutorhynchus assimilis TaxID=467358 RepID=A0A9N9MQY7_9CUCU|nr:unnamed protein product [Ceutorhynchus assimilis]